MTMRRYTPADSDETLDVWYRASLIAHPFLSDGFLETERRQLAERWLPAAETTVWEHDGVVVGFLSLVGNEVGGIFVDPGFQGQGIGRALMDGARDSCPFLELDVFVANAAGRRFYELYGFESVSRHVDEDSGQPSIRLRYDKRGPDGAAVP